MMHSRCSVRGTNLHLSLPTSPFLTGLQGSPEGEPDTPSLQQQTSPLCAAVDDQTDFTYMLALSLMLRAFEKLQTLRSSPYRDGRLQLSRKQMR